MPDPLHVIPVNDNAVLGRVPEGEHVAPVLRPVPDVVLFLADAEHYVGHLRPASGEGEEEEEDSP
eukprot:8601358-Lingulodinium_polyedra.AAC.1